MTLMKNIKKIKTVVMKKSKRIYLNNRIEISKQRLRNNRMEEMN